MGGFKLFTAVPEVNECQSLLQFLNVFSNLDIYKKSLQLKKLNFSWNLCLMSVKMPHEIVVFDLLWSL